MSKHEYSKENDNSESIIKDNIVMGKKLTVEGNYDYGRIILHSFSEYPEFVGMIDAENGEQITFAQMKDRSIRCALWLQKRGIGENDLVGLSTPVQINDYVPALATLFINAIFNPWHYYASSESVEHSFVIYQPKVMFACKETIDTLAKIAKDKRMDCKFVAFEKHHEHVSLEEIMAEQTQEEVDNFECVVPMDPSKKASRIMFSSGTTGPPKAIVLPYQSLVFIQIVECGLRGGMTCLWYSPMSWNTCNMMTLSTIQLRCTRIVHGKFDAEVTAGIIEKYKINFILWVPYVLMRSIRAGSVESGGFVSRQTKSSQYDSVGYLCSGKKLKIVDLNTSAVLGPNQTGEIYLKSELSMLGYFKNPEKTNETMVEDGWLRTGDLGYYNENAEIFFVNRLVERIKTNNGWIPSFEFEKILNQHPDVVESAIMGVEHPIDVERPLAFVVKDHDAKVTAEELIAYAASKNERYWLTGGLVFIDELPRTLNSKIAVRKLQEMAKAHAEQQRVL